MDILDMCNNLGSLGLFYFIKNLIKILCIATPILLVLFLTIDFVKAAISGDSQSMDKVKSIAVKRIIYAIVVFLVPYIVNGAMSLLGDTTTVSSCYELANSDTVASYAEAERLKQELQKTSEEKKREEIQKRIDRLNKQVDKNTRNAIINNNSSKSDDASISDSRVRANGKIAEASSSGLQKVSFKNGLRRWKWEYVFRFKDPKKAALAAQCMEAGVANNKHIKYCGNWRQLYDKTKKYGFDVSKVTSRTCTTCSPYVSVCVNYAGIPMKRGWNAANEGQILREINRLSKHFVIIHDPKTAQDYTKLYRGDILFKNKYNGMGHTVIAT